MKKFLALIAAVVLVPLGLMGANRQQWLPNEQPPSVMMNLSSTNPYQAFGEFILQATGGTGTTLFTDFNVTPGTGLTVNVGGSLTNRIPALYQYGPVDSVTFGQGISALTANPALMLHQYRLNTPAVLGPITVPATAGNSTAYIVECQGVQVDSTPVATNFVSPQNIASSASVIRERDDNAVCQLKAGTPAATGSQIAPTVDSGWIAIASFNVAYGNTTVASTTNIPGWSGFLPANAGNTLVTTNTAQNITATKTFVITQQINALLGLGGSGAPAMGAAPGIASDGQALAGILVNVATGSLGYQFMTNGALNGAVITPTGGVVALSAAINGASFNGNTFLAKTNGNLILNTAGTGLQVAMHYGDGLASPLTRFYDGGTANYSQLTQTGLSFSGASTSSYNATGATVYGPLSVQNVAVGVCLTTDASHNIISAGGACGLSSGTITNVVGTAPITGNVTAGIATIGIAGDPGFAGAIINPATAATGYNVYVSTSTTTETKQNGSPIAIGTAFTEPASGLIAGSALPTKDSAGGLLTPLAPTTGTSAAGALAATTYYVVVTYVNAAGETVASTEVTQAALINTVLTVTSPVANTPGATTASLFFGSDGAYSLDRSTSTFTLTSRNGATLPILNVAGGFNAGASSYFSNYATVTGTVTANYNGGSTTQGVIVYNGGTTTKSVLTGHGLATGAGTFTQALSAVGITSTAGVAVGGALTGATTGAFSSTLSAAGLTSTGTGSFGTDNLAPYQISVNGIGSGTGGGSSLVTQANSATIIAIGNRSAIVGGAYDATPYIYTIGTLTTNSPLTVGGALIATSGTFSGGLSATSGTFSSGITANNVASTNDMSINRAGTNVGALYFGNTASNYLYFDGTNFNLGGAGRLVLSSGMTVGGTLTGATTGAFSSTLSAAGLTSTAGVAVGGALTGATTGAFSSALSAVGLTSTAGVAVGGALTGATTGAFSSTLSALGITSTAGVAVGGALTGATTGAFSGAVTAGGLLLAADANTLTLGTTGAVISGSTSNTFINNHANTASNIVIADAGTITLRGPLNGATSLNVSGTTVTAGLQSTTAITSRAGGSVDAYVSPVYNASGATLAATTHSILITGTGPATTQTGCGGVSGTQYCSTVTLTGTSVFTSAATFSCTASISAGGYYQVNGNGYASWNSGSTIYVAQLLISSPYSVTCTGY